MTQPIKLYHPDAQQITPPNTFAKILVIGDGCVSRILAANHLIFEAHSMDEARQAIDLQTPDLIVADIAIAGIKLVKDVRENRYTRNLPIIIHSAGCSEQTIIEIYKAGADAFFTMPLNAEVFKAVVGRMLQRKRDDFDYYHSPESTISLIHSREISDEGKSFIDTLRRYIVNNIDDDDKLSAEALAEVMNVDKRTLYRRFKSATPYTPSEFVKSIRYTYAANLILTTSMNIQEVIYRVGMCNKAVFYTDFKKRYGMTPKEYRRSGTIS